MSNTLYETIAAEVGVSARTVRRVLSGETKGARRDNQERAARIRELAVAHNFRPNRAASSIRTGRFRQVALVTPADAAAFLPRRLLEGVGEALDERGVALQLSRLPSAALFTEGALPDVLAEHGVDGLLINVTDRLLLERQDELAAQLARYRIPAVWLNCVRTQDALLPDERGGAASAVDHLRASGHRRIAFLDTTRKGDWHHPALEARAAGYVDAMTAADLRPDLRRDAFVPLPRDHAEAKHLRAICDAAVADADAVICAGERELVPMALACARAGKELGREIELLVFHERGQLPVDGALVQRIPFERIGRCAVEELQRRIEDPTCSSAIPSVPYGTIRRSGGQA